MNVVDRYEINFPTWAVCAVEYDDRTGLSDEDERILKEWIRSMEREGLGWGIAFTSDVNAFDSNPEFGLPCETVKAEVYYFNVRKRKET